jgi:DNA-binding IclR family transcriptional regulator
MAGVGDRRPLRARGAGSGPSLQSVEQALRLLEAVADQGELGVSELAALLGRSPSGAFRLLSTLQANGYIEQNPSTKKYRLGLKLFELNARRVRRLDVREVARGYLEELVRTTGETARLDIFDRLESVTIEAVESPHAIQVRFGIGHRSTPYATSTGKAQLAFQPEEVVERVIANGLVAYTSNTLTDPQVLREELAQIRRRGFAVNFAAWREGACGLAAPVRGPQGQVIAAVGIGGPSSRLTARRIESLAPAVIAAAHEISRRMGWVPESPLEAPPMPAARTATADGAPSRRPQSATHLDGLAQT